MTLPWSRRAAVTVAGTALWFALTAPAWAALRVMVLPFEAPKDPSTVAAYGSGTADSLVNALSRMRDIVVVDRSTIQVLLKEQALAQAGILDERQAVAMGRMMGVEAVITGRVQVAGNLLRISASFVEVATGRVKSAKQVTGPFDQVFDLQDQIANSFLNEHGVTVSPQMAKRMSACFWQSRDPKAYEYYQRGREAYLQATTTGYREAVQWYGKALAVDGTYACAYAGMAEAKARWGYVRMLLGEPAQDMLKEGKAAALKALELQPEMAEAHRALALSQLKLGESAAAAAGRAVQLAPNDAEALTIHWLSLRDYDPDSEMILRALSLSPRLVFARDARAYGLLVKGRLNEAIRAYEATLDLMPDDAVASHYLAEALSKAGRNREAIEVARRVIRQHPGAASSFNVLGLALQRNGQADDAVEAFRTALRLNPAFADARENLQRVRREQNR